MKRIIAMSRSDNDSFGVGLEEHPSKMGLPRSMKKVSYLGLCPETRRCREICARREADSGHMWTTATNKREDFNVRSKLLFTLIAIMAVVLALPAGASEEEPDLGLALFEGEVIDLVDGWEDAKACLVWGSESVVECFRTEAELIERADQLESSRAAGGVASASSSCSTSLKLYDGTSYTGSTLYLYTRTQWINLSNYGFANRTSSFKVGACSAYFADYPNGGGSWYPTSYTQAWDQFAAMISGWNNRVSSIYMN